MRLLINLFAASLLTLSLCAQFFPFPGPRGFRGGGGGSSTITRLGYNKEGKTDGKLAFSPNVSKNSLLLAGYEADSNGTTLSGITDDQGNSWSLVRRCTDSNPAWGGEVWKAIAGSSGANSITATITGGSNGILFVAEYGSPDAVTPVPDSACAIEATTTVGPVVPTLSNSVLFILSYIGDGTSNPCTGFTTIDFAEDNSRAYIQEKTGVSAGSISASGCGSHPFFSNHVLLSIQ